MVWFCLISNRQFYRNKKSTNFVWQKLLKIVLIFKYFVDRCWSTVTNVILCHLMSSQKCVEFVELQDSQQSTLVGVERFELSSPINLHERPSLYINVICWYIYHCVDLRSRALMFVHENLVSVWSELLTNAAGESYLVSWKYYILLLRFQFIS